MSPIVEDALATSTMALEQVRDQVEAPFYFGRDLSCTDDVTEQMLEVDPKSPRAVAEAIYRRLSTPRGSLPDDRDYGTDLRSLLNHGKTVADIQALAGRVRSEVEKDDRVASSTVTVSPSSMGRELMVKIRVETEDPETGDFSMTLAATSAAVVLEAMAG